MSTFTSVGPGNNSTVYIGSIVGVTNFWADNNILMKVRMKIFPGATATGTPVLTVDRVFSMTGQTQGPYTHTVYWDVPRSTLTPGQWTLEWTPIDPLTGAVPGFPKSTTVNMLSSPVATPISPAPNAFIPWTQPAATDTAVNFTWTTSDSQSAYQILITKESDGTTVLDTGKTTSSQKYASVNIPAAQKEVNLRWQVRYWNAFDASSAYTASQRFTLGIIPTLVINAPTAGQVLTTGTPSVTSTVTLSGSRSLSRITAQLWKDTTKVWEKTLISPSVNPVTVSDPNFFMENGVTYTYKVDVTDSAGLNSFQESRSFSVSYTPPLTPPVVTTAGTNYDTYGYVELQWDGTTPDVDLYAYEIQRRDIMLDPNTGAAIVAEMVDFTTIGYKYENSSPNIWRDYLAPSGHRLLYRFRQIAYKFGTQVPGPWRTGETIDVWNSGYWLVSGTNGSALTVSTYRFDNVTGDDYTIEREKAEFPLIGRGRYQEQGTKMGVRGSMVCQLRDSPTGTAREKKKRLERFQDANSTAKLKTPFGDLYQVSLGDVSVARIPGTGRSEFMDVTIPYIEVVNR